MSSLDSAASADERTQQNQQHNDNIIANSDLPLKKRKMQHKNESAEDDNNTQDMTFTPHPLSEQVHSASQQSDTAMPVLDDQNELQHLIELLKTLSQRDSEQSLFAPALVEHLLHRSGCLVADPLLLAMVSQSAQHLLHTLLDSCHVMTRQRLRVLKTAADRDAAKQTKSTNNINQNTTTNNNFSQQVGNQSELHFEDVKCALMHDMGLHISGGADYLR
jgi:hypothetical protein